MDKESQIELTEFLDSELSDYGFDYNFTYCSDREYYEVDIFRYNEVKATCNIKYDHSSKSLFINMFEDTWEEIKEYNWTVKYFWICVGPELFSN